MARLRAQPPSPAAEPAPAVVAPAGPDGGVATDFAAATSFLYTGDRPAQTGVLQGAIDSRRAAVLRGRVTGRDGAPLPGVTISVLDHPEYGETQSRSDGLLDIAVNGGARLTVCYALAGYLPAQRSVQAPWRDYAWLPPAALIPLDAQVTRVDLSAAAPMQAARGSLVRDEAGQRQATLLFAQGTAAELVLPGGGTQPLNTLSVRATEFTVGAGGPAAMPGELPTSSGYTYAVELSVDEALAAGATDIRFSRPVFNYVENFLNFPTGSPVPTGYYDRTKGMWVASDNGRVIAVLGEAGGLATLDVDGSGQPASSQALAALGINDAERRQLAGLYRPGQSLWRVPITHFTPWDHNWPYGPPADAQPPNQPPPRPDRHEPDPCEQNGSIVECQNQVLGERIPLAGTPYSLNYRSNRVTGRVAARTLEVPLSGASIPASLARIELEITVAGQQVIRSFEARPNQSFRFVWDGKDGFGRPVAGGQAVRVRIGYVYPAVYLAPGDFGKSFAGFGRATTQGNRARQEITVRQGWKGYLSALDAREQGLGGWTLDEHHSYDAARQVLLLGDGRQRHAGQLNRVVSTVAGDGRTVFAGDGGPAADASLWAPHSVAVMPDGSLLIADSGHARIRRVGPDGIIATVAGSGRPGDPLGDGGPATAANLSDVRSVAAAPDGSFLIADRGHSRIRRVGPDGIITTVAGDGGRCDYDVGVCGDGGPAATAQLNYPVAVALAPDGSIYIAESEARRVRRVAPDGVITTVAGGGAPAAGPGDGGPAIGAVLGRTHDVAVGPDGSLYLLHDGFGTISARVRRVSPDGIISTVAGSEKRPPPPGLGDGGPATAARIHAPRDITVGPDGTVYLIDHLRVRAIKPDGTIVAFAGTGDQGVAADGTAALQATFFHPWGLALDEDGGLLIAELNSNRVRKVGTPLPGFGFADMLVPSEDGSELYRFDASGRHLRTHHTLTGAVLRSFRYDAGGRLQAIEDGDGNVTSIERDAAGNPGAIVGPDGQRTALVVNADGYLARLSDPAGAVHQFAYRDAGGLLSGYTDPRGNLSRMSYDDAGRLVRDEMPDGASWALGRVENPDGYTVTLQNAAGHSSSFQTQELPSDDVQLTSTFPDGTKTQALLGAGGGNTISYPSGSAGTVVESADPRWNMQAPLPSSTTLTSPGGVTYRQTVERDVTLENPGDPLSLKTLSDRITVNGQSTTIAYDGATRTIAGSSPARRQDSTTLDAQGRVTRMQDGSLLPLVLGYDSRGRPMAIAQGDGAESRSATLAYNAAGYVERLTDALGRQTSFSYDAAGRVTRQTRPDGAAVQLAYDANGNLTALTPPQRPPHNFSYTAGDQLAEYVPPDIGAGAGRISYRYNADRRLAQLVRSDGATIQLGYDDAGRPATVTTPRGQTRYGYESGTGRLVSAAAPGGPALSFSYDGSLPTAVAWSGVVNGRVAQTINSDLRVASQSVNGSQSVAFSYDADGLLTAAGGMALTRDAGSGLVGATALGGVRDTASYNGFGETAAYSATHNGAALYAVSYNYDKLGRITGGTETIGGVTNSFGYTYDVAGRLVEVRRGGSTVERYTYDANGNRLSAVTAAGTANGAYDAQDRLTRYGATTYSYTAHGELRAKGAAGQTTTYDYDALGNLMSVALPDGTRIEYLVDALNRRAGKRVNGSLVQGWLYQDSLNPVAELDAGGNVVSRFVYGERPNVPAYMIRGGATFRILVDHLGSPRLVVNVSTGAVAQRLDYDAFGRVTLDSNPGFQPFGFAGGLYDPATGLTRFGARDYDAETGRWTAKDPIMFEGDELNLYVYSGNDAVNFRDATGLKSRLAKIKDSIRSVSGVEEARRAGRGSDRGRQGPIGNF